MLDTLTESHVEGNEFAFSQREINKSKRLLERLLQKGRKTVFSETVVITPELASLILQHNPEDENRKLSQATVNKYATDMAGGRWQGLNGQAIVISSDGYLNDGQHRLNAVIQSNTSILTNITLGVDRESRLTLDQNKVRTSGDYLHMLGVKNANNIASVASILIMYERGLIRQSVGGPSDSKNKPTKAEIHKYAINRLDEIESGLEFVGHNWKELPCPPAHIIAAKIILEQKTGDTEAVSSFIEQICLGENLTRTSPAYHVRSRLQYERLAGTLAKGTTLEIVFRGWNALRKNGSMKRLAISKELPEIME